MKKTRQRATQLTLVTCLISILGCSNPQVTEKNENDTFTKADSMVMQTAGEKQYKNSVVAGLEESKEILATPPTPASTSQVIPRKKKMEFGRSHQVASGPQIHQQAALATVSESRLLPGRRILPGPVYSDFNRESYNQPVENSFVVTANDPLSTFSIDVDTASYANIRRWLQSGKLPPVGAVRIEEMINYFSYDLPEPAETPIVITTEVGPCLWQPDNRLVRIGLKAKELDSNTVPPSNLVFLIDVSGSMNSPRKLPLLKKGMGMLTGTLTASDRISIVVYAGSNRVVLPPTSGDQKDTIKDAINRLNSGGSTHASSGIRTAYELARQTFMPSGNNRVILASDGDFNVGVTSRGELEQLIAKERESGVFLTVLGFGSGNYHDDTMELLADKGNGNYSYIDNLLEAKKVLIKERGATLFTLAKDVKLQIEFNPALVGGYRLVGYENRILADSDFNDDKKDAGEIGAGHSVTALYEIIPAGSTRIPSVDPLKYQTSSPARTASEELLTIKLRYKDPGDEKSKLLTKAVTAPKQRFENNSEDFRFASSVAGFGMLLRKSDHVDKLTYSEIVETARNSRGTDRDGYRTEFVKLVELAELLTANR